MKGNPTKKHKSTKDIKKETVKDYKPKDAKKSP
jgi:hypothetical protein